MTASLRGKGSTCQETMIETTAAVYVRRRFDMIMETRLFRTDSETQKLLTHAFGSPAVFWERARGKTKS